MTIGAIETLASAVFGVREARLKSRSARRSAAIARLRVTHIARTDVAPADRSIRRVTRIALIMRG